MAGRWKAELVMRAQRKVSGKLRIQKRKLPKLPVVITRDGKIVRRVLLDDPRERYCSTFNELDIGAVAVPA
jgi:hypothetical protein